MDSELFKNRSVGSCLSDAFDLFRTNLKTLFRRLWMAALMLSLILAAIMMSGLQHPAAGGFSPVNIICLLLLYVFAIGGFVWFYSIIISLLNGKSIKVNMPRVTRLTLLLLGLFILIGILCAIAISANYMAARDLSQIHSASARMFVGVFAFGLVFFIAALPLYYSVMKYYIETDSKVRSVFKKPYVTGFRHWGYIFLTVLLTEIINFVISMVVCLPLYVILLCFVANSNGMAFGDPSGLSWGFGILAFVTAVVCTFADLFVRPWIVFTFYYAYGSIDEKEQGRTKRKEIIVSTEPSTDFEEVK